MSSTNNSSLSISALPSPEESPLIKIIQGNQPFFARQKKCPRCGATQINLVQMLNYSFRHAGRSCRQCEAFRDRETKLEHQEKLQRRHTTIIHLPKSPQFSQWEGTFLEGVKSKKISPKQQEILARIEAKVGGQS